MVKTTETEKQQQHIYKFDPYLVFYFFFRKHSRARDTMWYGNGFGERGKESVECGEKKNI